MIGTVNKSEETLQGRKFIVYRFSEKQDYDNAFGLLLGKPINFNSSGCSSTIKVREDHINLIEDYVNS